MTGFVADRYEASIRGPADCRFADRSALSESGSATHREFEFSLAEQVSEFRLQIFGFGCVPRGSGLPT